MEEVKINDQVYQLIKDINEGFNLEEVKSKLTNYFVDYDYIVGDWAYNKLRLKGFYDDTNKKVKKINNITFLDNYLKSNCAFGCKHFLLKKMCKK